MSDQLPDLLSIEDLFPLETEQTLAERWALWANEGVDPAVEADRWVDVRPGGPFDMISRIVRRDLAVAYDRVGVELLAAALPQYSFGSHLDRHAEAVGVRRTAATRASGAATFKGAEGTLVAEGTVVAVPPITSDEEAPEFETTSGGTIPAPVAPATRGSLNLPIRARVAGVAGLVGPGAIVNVLTGPDVEVVNAEATVGGTERQTDAELLGKVLRAWRSPRGGGRVADYVAFGESQDGVVDVAVHRHHDGPGTVLVVVTGAGGQPVAQETLDALEARRAAELPLDPDVTIATSVVLEVAIAATVELDPGYSLAGTATTAPVQQAAQRMLDRYVRTVRSGGEIVLAEVIGELVRAPGVRDVDKDSVTINGADGNVAVAMSPPQAPVLATLDLTVTA